MKGVGVPMNFKFFIHVYFILIFLVLSSSIGDRELQIFIFFGGNRRVGWGGGLQ